VQKINNGITYSPSDLCRFMASPFAAWMERYLFENPDGAYQPDEDDPFNSLLQAKGQAHETAFLQKLRDDGKSVVVIEGKTLQEKHEATRSAIASGVDVIYQAYLVLAPFQGYADFLVKTPDPRLPNGFSYEVWDTKLSRQPKPYFVIQLCCYAEMLNSIQGCYPQFVAVVLGNNEVERLRTDNYRYFYQYLKQQFITSEGKFDANAMPNPADSKEWGRWSGTAEKLLLDRDHLSQVATITRSQIKALESQGITTATQLAESSHKHIPKIPAPVLKRLQAQSRIQLQTKKLYQQGEKKPAFEILTPNGEAKGLALLPPSSPLDIFFDIEGFPLVEGGLEYLWGVTYFDDDKKRQYKEYWAHTSEQEKQAFQEFVQWAYARWQKDPTMHIYHYANYEVSACRRLMGKYGVCEYEIDQLLRNEVFVDLYTIVKHGLLIGEPRYSIKNVEHLYRGLRETDVGSGGDSVVAYEMWREKQDGDSYKNSKILQSLRDYNQDDCNSTQELTQWLRERQAENKILYVGSKEVKVQEISEEIAEKLKLRDRLLSRAQKEIVSDQQQADVTETLAWLLEFHRREEKPSWWRLFDRLGLSEIELTDDLDCIAACQRTSTPPFKPSEKARHLAYEYRFDKNQELKPPRPETKMWVLGQDNMQLELHTFDMQNGLLSLKSKAEPPTVVTLIPNDIVHAEPIPSAITAVVKSYENGTLGGKEGKCAILDFLYRRSPRIKDYMSGAIAASHDSAEQLSQIIKAVNNLENSYLCIQGPPGAGKSYTGTHVIADLLKQGKRIGISSNSHKAINNLLIGAARLCQKEKINGKFFCTKDTGPEINELDITVIDNKSIINHVQNACVIGTTAWGFSREEVADKFDYLFVDEAGQVSIANLVGISRSTKNLILMGDQMQLGQPTQGSHPGFSGQSVLEYLLQDHATIPDELGVFLGKSYRMHPAINRFISDAIYEGRLESATGNDKQIIQVPSGYQGPLNKEAGIIYIPVEHEGNVQASEEEAKAIAELANELLGRTFIDKDGSSHKMDWSHILFVAPYNYQVNILQQALGGQARVGSVDKFQGQEAQVVFLSLSASDASDSPRGLAFLLDKHRINVAISRAMIMAVIVASPRLIQNFKGSIKEMELANLYSRILYS